MFIRKLALQNFRSHVETVLELEPVTIIRGANAVGKSSIEKAIELTLGGRTDETTIDGKGSVGLIRAGESKAIVKMALRERDTEHIITMALKDTARVVQVADPGGAEYRDYLTQHRTIFSCLCNNRFFVDLDEDRQKSILSSVVLPKTYDWPEWVRKAASECALNIHWSATPFEILEEGHKLAYDARRDTNRDVKNFEMPQGDVSAADQVGAIRTKLDGRKRELEELVRKSGSDRAAMSGRAVAKEQAERRLEEAQNRLQREEQSVAGLEAAILSKDVLKKRQGVAKELKRALEIDAARAGIEQQITEKKAEAKKIMASEESVCDTCGQAITKEHLERSLKAIEQKRAELESLLQGNIAARKGLGNPEEAQREIDAHERATASLAGVKQRISDERTIIKDAEEKLAELSAEAAKAESDADNEAAIADLRSKVEIGTAKLTEAQIAAALKARIEKAGRDRDALIARQGSLEKLVAYFGEDARAEMLGASIGKFEESMNSSLAKWGYRCKLTIEPYRFTVLFGGTAISVAHLSKSQRYRFAAAFQVALAVATGFKFVVVDEADIYTSKERTALYGLLAASVKSGVLEQAIILVSDERIEAEAKPGVAFYALRNTAGSEAVPVTEVARLA